MTFRFAWSRPSCSASPKRGRGHHKLQADRWLRRGNAKFQALVVNNTGATLVLRNKYRDVWEDVRFKIANGDSVIVSFTPDQVYERLGAFIQTPDQTLTPTYPRILISAAYISKHKEIVVSYSEAKSRYSVVTTDRQEDLI